MNGETIQSMKALSRRLQAWSPVHPAPEALIVSYDNYRDVTDIVAVIARV